MGILVTSRFPRDIAIHFVFSLSFLHFFLVSHISHVFHFLTVSKLLCQKVKAENPIFSVLLGKNFCFWQDGKRSILTCWIQVLSTCRRIHLRVNFLGVGNNPIIGYLLFFSIGFFLLGLFFTVRIIWFIIDPSSRVNILVGKAIITTADIGFRFVVIVFITFLQVFNGIMLYLVLRYALVLHLQLNPFPIAYLSTLVLSFIVMIPLSHAVIFRLMKQIRFRDWITIFCFFSPWIVLIVYGLLLRVGVVRL